MKLPDLAVLNHKRSKGRSKMGLEGIVSKRLGSRYRSGRHQRLAQIQEPGRSGGEARGRGGVGTIGMTDRRLPELIGICVLAGFSCGVALAFDREFFAAIFAMAAGFAGYAVRQVLR